METLSEGFFKLYFYGFHFLVMNISTVEIVHFTLLYSQIRELRLLGAKVCRQ